MKTLTIKDIRDLDPCYDPGKYLPDDWSGTVLDILDLEGPSVEDKFWVVLRSEFLSDKLMRLFAVWCARQVQHLMKDERSIKALDVAEAYAHGNANDKELAAAMDAAWAARAAAMAAARDAAGAAAWAMAAAWAAARAAARAAAGDAAWAARAAAMAAAGDAAMAAQLKKLKEMINDWRDTEDVK